MVVNHSHWSLMWTSPPTINTTCEVCTTWTNCGIRLAGHCFNIPSAGIILCMRPANEMRQCNAVSHWLGANTCNVASHWQGAHTKLSLHQKSYHNVWSRDISEVQWFVFRLVRLLWNSTRTGGSVAAALPKFPGWTICRHQNRTFEI